MCGIWWWRVNQNKTPEYKLSWKYTSHRTVEELTSTLRKNCSCEIGHNRIFCLTSIRIKADFTIACNTLPELRQVAFWRHRVSDPWNPVTAFHQLHPKRITWCCLFLKHNKIDCITMGSQPLCRVIISSGRGEYYYVTSRSRHHKA
jgi:hypothetical protein